MGLRATATIGLLALAVLAIFAVDVATGPLIGFALFYLVPIAVAAFRVGRRPAVGIAVEAFVAWLVADALARPQSELAYSIWNGVTRLVIFTAAAILLAEVLEDREALRGVEERRRRFLRLLERNLPEPLARAEEQIARIERAGADAAPAQSFALLHRAIDDLRYLSREFLILGQADIDRRPPQDVDLVAAAAQAMRYVDAQRVDVAGGTERLIVRGEPERIEHAITDVLRSALHAAPTDVWLALRERDGDAMVEVTARTTRWATEDDELALARLVAQLYGGRVTTRSGDATTTVTLAFPSDGKPASRD